MDLNVKKDKRNNGKYVQKNGDVKQSSKTKKQAVKDIIKECGDGMFFNACYINREHIVLIGCQSKIEILSINTCIL